ncbi:hypothetical protein [Spirosoma sordidisoli]|uniref:Uncharacterized protein n=1 Tax=Spirosoma sordidisoli TaxID=2502893 RepID=A0A4Q2UJT9_9BACT|nr:hypothetical protein [Spirosoma sordidisoli]RYC69767.1 hypothetical protein EQG79_14320 [Spirosoma sordidisoli]
MTSRYVTFDIRVYPLVRKFLAYHYGTAPFEVSNVSNPYSSYLYACLDRYDHRDTQRPRKFSRMTDTLTLSVSTWRVKSFAVGMMSPTKQASFNDFVRDLFFEKLASEVAVATSFGVGIKTAIQRFLDRYGITERELSIGLAIRYYYRYRDALRLEYCHLLPATPSVILPHERDSTDGSVESWGRQVA